jgi:5'(3')-deoxyribonucleotidase
MLDPFPSAPPRFRVEPLSTDFVRLVDVIFGVTLTQSLVIYRKEIVSFSPMILIVTLVVVYMTVTLSWVGYHRSISKYPYNKSRWSMLRLSLDIFILVVYAFLAFAAPEPTRVIVGLAVVFMLYSVDGLTRRAEWRDSKVSKPWLSVIFSALLIGVWWLLQAGYLSAIIAVVTSGVLVFLFRPIRKWLGFPKLLIVGVDIDGVLGEQIPALISRLQRNKHIADRLTKDDITEWAFTFEDTDVAREMEEALLDPEFVLSMPTVAGAEPAMQKLYTYAHVVVATSRPVETEAATITWLRLHFKFHEVAITRETGKAVLGLEYLIDDNIDNLKTFVRAGGVGILFSQPWNRAADDDPEIREFFKDNRLKRCSGWPEVLANMNGLRTTGKLPLNIHLEPASTG